MLRKLAAYRRQNQLDLALQELGRIERTLFMLDWLESPELRRRCHAGLNKSARDPRCARPRSRTRRRPRP
jgi:TnpA family transposase